MRTFGGGGAHAHAAELNKGKLVLVPFCGDPKCEEAVTGGARPLPVK